MKEKIKVSIEVETKRIVDLFISACEGGSNYWVQELTPKGKGDAYEAMLAGFTLIESPDCGPAKTHKVTPKDIEKAMHLFANGGSQEEYGAESWSAKHFADWKSEEDDAVTADVFLQLCVFGKVIYG